MQNAEDVQLSTQGFLRKNAPYILFCLCNWEDQHYLSLRINTEEEPSVSPQPSVSIFVKPNIYWVLFWVIAVFLYCTVF